MQPFVLRECPEDKRDFSHSQVFGSIALADIPTDDWQVSIPLAIKNQSDTDMCAAYALAAVCEDEDGIELNPEFSFMASKYATGNYTEWGSDLRTMSKTAVDFGLLPQEMYPFKNEDNDRDYLANPENWFRIDKNILALGEENKKKSFFFVDGPGDNFDNFRMVMWQNRAEMRSILTGCRWRTDWNDLKDGIIPESGWENSDVVPHAFKIFGQKKINGQLYLMAQLSNGTYIGDKGIFYFPRSVVNSEFKYKAITFKDMPKEYAQYLSENKISVNDGLFTRILKVIKNIILKW